MSDATGKCDDCGRFMKMDEGSNAYIYDFVAMACDYQHFRCNDCTLRLGPIHSNARPSNGDMSGYETCNIKLPEPPTQE